MPSPIALRVLGCAYVVISVLLWPLTTIISTAFALRLKIPRLPASTWSTRRRALRLESQIVD